MKLHLWTSVYLRLVLSRLALLLFFCGFRQEIELSWRKYLIWTTDYSGTLVRKYANCTWFFINTVIKGPFQIKRKQKRTWGEGSKSNNNERKISARHEIIDYIAEKMSVITQVCKETKLWIHPNLRRPNFSFTYSLKFTYFCNVDIWTLKKKDFRENKKPWTVIKTVSKDKNV